MKRFLTVLTVFVLILAFVGCGMMESDRVKLRDLDFTILSDEVLPEELKTMIEERKTEAFKMTYSDEDALYICIGYGQQESGGYSITVDELYLTEDAIYVETTLLGPDAAARENQSPSCPYIVIRTEKLDQMVICE